MLIGEIKNDAGVLQQVRIFIEQLRQPFGFLQREIEGVQKNIRRQQADEAESETKGDHKYFNEEKKAEAIFDGYVNQLARRANVDASAIPWLNISKVVVWVFLGLTILTMLQKPSVVSLTVAMLALYVLDNPQSISRQTFRGLVLLLVVSWVYDFLWLFLFSVSAAEEDEEDGGNEYKLRRFVRLITYINFLFKVIVVLVFWKDSLDFRNIIRKGQKAGPDDELEDILAQYEPNNP